MKGDLELKLKELGCLVIKPYKTDLAPVSWAFLWEEEVKEDEDLDTALEVVKVLKPKVVFKKGNLYFFEYNGVYIGMYDR